MPTLEWIGKEKAIKHYQKVPYKIAFTIKRLSLMKME